ncbi:MAG TPA: efflux RND transporter permease subunit [Gemmatirosa sp.]
MWIVKLSLRRPFTTACLAILMILMGAYAALSMQTDIFPAINLPVVSAVWVYNGLPAKEMEGRVMTVAERSYTIGVTDIEHIESEALDGLAVIRVFLQPGTSVENAVAQITASSQSAVRTMPPGITPPYIIRFNATDVPVMQIGIAGNVGEQELNDAGNQFVRNQLVTAQGTNIPPVFGGAPKQVNVDIDLNRLYAFGLTPSDVSSAINSQNVILPTGTARLGDREYRVRLDASPTVAERLNDLPIKLVNGQMVYIRDVAQVRLGAGVQTNIVRVDGRRGAYLEVLKTGSASTLRVVKQVRDLLGRAQASVPGGITLSVISDQSTYVRASIQGVIREGLIAACLTATMILLFLGSWRSTLIVVTSIPLSILTSIVCLWALHQSLNIMTLGGLALAIGILVDDATVEIENMHRNLGEGKDLLQSILDGAAQIAVPAFVSSLSISIVFVPIFFLSGPAASLFRPLAMSVIFAVLASYILSRTLVPTMARYLLKKEADLHHGADQEQKKEKAGWTWRLNVRIDRQFEKLRDGYHRLLAGAIGVPVWTLAIAALFALGSLFLMPQIGQDFFPTVDAGQLRLHVRARPGIRLEETELIFGSVERTIRRIIAPSEIGQILDDVGLAGGGVTLATGDQATIGGFDGEILITLAEKHTGSVASYTAQLRDSLRAEYPDVEFYFQPADIVTRILNLGLPSPIDVQITGRSAQANYAVAQRVADKARLVPGATDVRVEQVNTAPELAFSIDRLRAEQAGVSTRDVATSMLIALSGSFQSAPNFWLDPSNGVQYQVAVQVPPYQLSSIDALARTPVAPPGGSPQPQLLSNLISESRDLAPAIVTHYNVQPSYDVFASATDRDLGGVASEIEKLANAEKLPKGSELHMRGQVESMRTSIKGLVLGILAAMLLVYVLLVVNFQSWIDPLIIVLALPGALAGTMWGLFTSHTTWNVPSLMGTIMALGVATSNSVLLLTFAEDERAEGKDAHDAAISAGVTRLRPVIMTALAMILGMLPMALGMGEGGEQNAPLGRAVIGGLLVASLYTLFVIPTLYSLMRKPMPAPDEELPEAALTGREKQREDLKRNGGQPNGQPGNGQGANGSNGSNGYGANGDGADGDGHDDGYAGDHDDADAPWRQPDGDRRIGDRRLPATTSRSTSNHV